MTAVDTALLDRIRAIEGDRAVVTGDLVALRSCDPFRNVPPESPLLLRPASTDGLSAMLALCHAAGQKVVIHGGRTGVAGGADAGAHEWIVSTERMDRILDIDPVGMTATVEAGVTLASLDAALADQGLLYPIDLGSKGSATIGGTIATNAGGNRVVRWGMTRQNVSGLEVVLADGTVVPLLNRHLKNNTGYDLKQLFIGSEGTLGIVTRAVLKLVTRPTTQNVALVALPDFAAVLALLRRARTLAQLSAFEVMWHDYYAAVASVDPSRTPLSANTPFYALVEALGSDDEMDRQAFERCIEGALEEGLIVDAVLSQSARQAEALWQVREGSDALVRYMGPFLSFDVSVPIHAADAFVAAAREALAARFAPLKTVAFGHLGDGNIHLGVHIGPDTPAQAHAVESCVYAVLARFDGALTAEHGIGTRKRDFLPARVPAEALATMRRLRHALDPQRLLNDAVLFPPDRP